jgi:hypothetical protein
MPTAEHRRLQAQAQGDSDWRLWGPYLAERAWGTVREDYSTDGEAWRYFPHDHARSRAYRWNEDGLAGISDVHQYLCLALAMHNGADPILKERLFGLDNEEGNHGEDVKEYYWYLDATPTHSYLKVQYRYPHAAYPYDDLVVTNAERSRHEPEYELIDTGVLDANRFFDVDVEYAKAADDDIVMRVVVHNRAPVAASIDLLPTLWFRNTWSWGYEAGPMQDVPEPPSIRLGELGDGWLTAVATHPVLGTYHWSALGATDLWFTENDSDPRLFGLPPAGYVKDAFHRRLVGGEVGATNPARRGTKAAAIYRHEVPARGTRELLLRLSRDASPDPFADVDEILAARRGEADEFYAAIQPAGLDAPRRRVHREACAGLIWSKQLYSYDVEQWLDGDPAGPAPPPARRHGRNAHWRHLNNHDVISMPDAWEYPWYAAWDLAFHCIPIASFDPGFAKQNLRLMTREWYMHPNGQLPAYEWGFGNVNPPVFAWATRRIYELDARSRGTPDVDFLESMFHKLLLNFTWWVNRVDTDGNNVFQGGFLGLDNISLFDRSKSLPTGGHIDQSDGTAWMAFFTQGMLKIAFELAHLRPAYQDVATKFYEHFLAIARAMNAPDHSLWDERDGFFYDVLHLPDGSVRPLRVRSLVGLLPLIGVEVIADEVLDAVPEFRRRMEWFSRHRPHHALNVASVERPGVGQRHLLSILDEDRLRSVLSYMLDPDEFLSPHGIRSLSKIHEEHPFVFSYGGETVTVGYEPGESTTGIFGGNSNWRGPVWFPLNYLIVEALHEYHDYYGDQFTVEYPTGSGREATLDEVADDLAERLVGLFLPDASGRVPALGDHPVLQEDPLWNTHPMFFEYFHGDTGAGLGASHQTGWTALVAKLIDELGRR